MVLRLNSYANELLKLVLLVLYFGRKILQEHFYDVSISRILPLNRSVCKVGCVCPMVVVSILPYAEFGCKVYRGS